MSADNPDTRIVENLLEAEQEASDQDFALSIRQLEDKIRLHSAVVLELHREKKALVTQLADAQATIAALHARVKELEEWQQIVAGTQDRQDLIYRLSDHLTQRTAERDTARRRVDELEAREVDVVLLREDLERRTAELERVTGELQKAERCISEWVDRHSTYFSKLEIDFAKLHALIAALPKVEGEITCSQQFDSAWRLHYWQVEAYEVAGECVYRLNNLREDDAKAYAALLQHRQGME